MKPSNISLAALVNGAVLGTLLLTAPAHAGDLPSFFDEGKAEAALTQIFDQAKGPTKALSLDIYAYRLTVEVQDPAAPKHIDAWIDELATGGVRRWLAPETISGPRAVDPTLIDPDLDANLFELKPADAAIVPRMIADAVKRARLEDPATDAHLLLKRQLHLIPAPSSGPPEWDIEISSGRERASVYADMAGHLTHANFDGTRRAQMLNYLAGGKELDDVVASIADVLGQEPIIKSMIVYNHNLVFEAKNPEHPDRVGRFTAGINGVYRDLVTEDVANIKMPGDDRLGRFALADVDWSLLPKLEQAARDRLQLPGGRIGLVKLTKPDSGVGGPALEWEINIEAANDQAVAGYVSFDVKGNVLRTKFPRGKGPKLDLLDAANIAPAFDALKKALGEHAAMTELDFRNERLMVTTKDPKKPGGQLVFEYRGEAVDRSIMPPLDWPTFGPDWFFDLSAAAPTVPRWADLQKDTLARLGMADAKIERVTISKQKLMMPRNDRVLIEIRAEEGKRGGRVVYDMTGKMVDIVKP